MLNKAYQKTPILSVAFLFLPNKLKYKHKSFLQIKCQSLFRVRFKAGVNMNLSEVLGGLKKG